MSDEEDKIKRDSSYKDPYASNVKEEEKEEYEPLQIENTKDNGPVKRTFTNLASSKKGGLNASAISGD